MEFVINLKDLVSPVVRQTTGNVNEFRSATRSAGAELGKLATSAGAEFARLGSVLGTGLARQLGALPIAKQVGAAIGKARGSVTSALGSIGAGLGRMPFVARLGETMKEIGSSPAFKAVGARVTAIGAQAAKAGATLATFAKSGVMLAASAVTTLAKASVGAAVGVAAFGIKTALMFRGMGQYAGQVERFNFNVKRLFRGVDVTPVIRAAQRLADFFDVTRDSGREMSSILTRGVNLAARAIEAAVPIGEEFVWGLIAGFYIVEATAYRVATAILKIGGPAIKWALKFTEGINIASIAGKLGIAVFLGVTAVLLSMAVATALTVIPLIALAGAVVYVGGKLYGLIDALGLAKPLMYGLGAAALFIAAPALLTAAAVAALAYGLGWLIDKVIEAVKWFKEWAGLGGKVQTATTGIADSVSGLASKLPGGDKATESGKALSSGIGPSFLAAVPAANENGKAIGAGLAQGLLAGIPGVEAASAQLVASADQSTRVAAQIRSPARRFMAPGKYMGLGVAEGIEQSAPAVQTAAEQSLVPSVPSPFAGGTASAAGAAASTSAVRASGVTGAGAISIHVENLNINGRPAEGEMKRMHEAWLTDVAVQMGLTAA